MQAFWRGSLERCDGARFLAPRAPGHHSKLEDARRPEREDDDRPKNQGKQQRHRQRELALENQECDLDFLPVLKDEDEDDHECDQADDDRGPGAAQPGPTLTWKRVCGLRDAGGSRFAHLSHSVYQIERASGSLPYALRMGTLTAGMIADFVMPRSIDLDDELGARRPDGHCSDR